MGLTLKRETAIGGVTLPPLLCRCLPPDLVQTLRESGCGRIEEIHLRVGAACAVRDGRGRNLVLTPTRLLLREEMERLIRLLCDGAPYARSVGMDRGYLCPGGGIRVGLCGLSAAQEQGAGGVALQRIDAVCIRLPGEFAAVGRGIVSLVRDAYPRGVLFYSLPAVGKTTLIRALARLLSSGERPLRCVLVDTRRELDDGSLAASACLDVLSGYPKREGIEIAVRTLGAQIILCDELGGEESRAVLSATLYGVPLIATAHAATLSQLLCRPELQLLRRAGSFAAFVGLTRRAAGEDYHYEIRAAEDAPWS